MDKLRNEQMTLLQITFASLDEHINSVMSYHTEPAVFLESLTTFET